jgi:argininosuccinate lyase
MQSGDLLGISSLMPQKRNPAALEQLRAQSSLLLAQVQGPYLVAHNVRTGMFDYRSYDPLPGARPVLVFGLLEKIVNSLVVDREQARAEVDADYSTVTEIADTLLRAANVPFRTGHHFASDLTDYGRSRRKLLHEISYGEAAQLYLQQNGQAFPLDEASYARCIDAGRMISSRKGLGGPQPAEVDRMLGDERQAAGAALQWGGAARSRLRQATEELHRMTALLGGRAT